MPKQKYKTNLGAAIACVLDTVTYAYSGEEAINAVAMLSDRMFPMVKVFMDCDEFPDNYKSLHDEFVEDMMNYCYEKINERRGRK